MLNDRAGRTAYSKAFRGRAGEQILAELMEVSGWNDRLGYFSDPREAERQAGKQDIVNHILNRLGITGNPAGDDNLAIVRGLMKVKPWEMEPGGRQEEADDGNLSG